IRLGELLIRHEACTLDDVSLALERQKSESARLGELLVRSGTCTNAQIESALEAQRLAAHPIWASLERLGWHSELRTSEVTTGASSHVVAGLPANGQYLRFDPVEWEVAEAIAHSSTYAEILTRVWECQGILVAPAQVADLADRLWAAGLLLDPERPAPAHASRTWLDWLVWRIPLWDPSRFLEALSPVFKTTSSLGWFAVVWLPAALAALGLFAFRSSEVMNEVRALSTQYHSLHLFRIYALLFFSLGVHEFGHAAVCSALGGVVRQMGLMLYVGMPFGFCDTSEAYRLPLRSRVAVSLGGLYYQLGMAALCVLAWAWLPLPTAGRMLCLDLAIISTVAGVFNLIPFARLDGYYLVADLLGIPNLQGRAFSYIGRKMLGRSTEVVTSREALLLSVYGLMGLGTVGMLALLAFRFWAKHLGL
ncbi:MAG TPA: hypothetical protein V6D05_16045, partial [Stenomitos sp.]